MFLPNSPKRWRKFPSTHNCEQYITVYYGIFFCRIVWIHSLFNAPSKLVPIILFWFHFHNITVLFEAENPTEVRIISVNIGTWFLSGFSSYFINMHVLDVNRTREITNINMLGSEVIKITSDSVRLVSFPLINLSMINMILIVNKAALFDKRKLNVQETWALDIARI